ncbi:MAG: glycogen synthase [Polyangiaceae bacterium]|nr:glycogen synthase [Polyangiaceae bacterium]
MVSAEVGPWVRETDAADAVASLSKALRQLGHNVTVLAPRHPGFEAGGLMAARRLTPLSLPDAAEVTVFDAQLPSGVQLTLFDAPVLFDRPGVYGEGGKEYPDNAKRFGLLSVVAAALVRARGQQGQAFDIVHLHDAPAALVPLALRRIPGPALPTVLTIHDATRQGSFPLKEADALGIPKDVASDDSVRLNNKLNVLKAGMSFADAITTVSPHYAEEMATEARSGALAELVRALKTPLVGVANGIDYGVFNPATDAALDARYDAEDPANKGREKTALLRRLELELDVERPLVVAVAELGKEQGMDLVAGALSTLLKQDLSLVVAGSGAAGIAKRFETAQSKHRDRFLWLPEVDSQMYRRLHAAADIAIVPARHAPSAAGQLVAARYGAVPVVHASGGLVDSVVDADAKLTTGTGFLFDDDTVDGLVGAVERALAAYRSPAFAKLRRRVMRLDLSWDRPARRYLQIYRQTIGSTA